MSAKSFSSCKRLWQSMLASTLCAMALSACSENESQFAEMRQLKEKLAAAEKKAAEAVAAAQQAPPPAPASASDPKPDTETMAKLEAATAKIASLEQELQTARAASPPAAASGTTNINADSFREFVKSMERDLLTKAGELQEAVEHALPSANIQETTVKRLRLPEQLNTAFQSAVVFNIAGANGEPKRLEFPVQAGLDGQWRMPGVNDVQQHLTAMAAQPQAAPATVASTPAPAPASAFSAPANPHATSALPMAAQGSVPQPAGILSQPGGPATYVIQWGDAAPAKAPAQQPAAQSQPAAVPATAAAPKPAPAPAPRSVPKPLMPVQQDIQIRFE